MGNNAEIFAGRPLVEAINSGIISGVEVLRRKNITPTLAVVRVGEREDDISYERSVGKRGENLGIGVRLVTLPENIGQEELIKTVNLLNEDDFVHGVLILRPLPRHIDDMAVCAALSPGKDVDGITDASLASVFTGRGCYFAPCTARACMEMLDFYGVDPSGKRAVVVGRSLVVGRPAAMMLVARNATVTVCHTKTADMPSVCRDAEILIVSAGRAKVIGEDYLAPGQIVIDVGINIDGDGKLSGDVDFEAAVGIVKGITPVPNGVGTVTTSLLLRNTLNAAQKAFAL